MTKDQIKECILSLGFIDNTKNWNSPYEDNVWFMWPGAGNNAILFEEESERLSVFPSIDLNKKGRLHFSDARYINVSGKALRDYLKEFRDNIINFKKEQRLKKIEEL